jgi:hypothetical protein
MFRKNLLPQSSVCLFFTLKVEAAGTSKTLAPTYQIIHHHIPGDYILLVHGCKNRNCHRNYWM